MHLDGVLRSDGRVVYRVTWSIPAAAAAAAANDILITVADRHANRSVRKCTPLISRIVVVKFMLLVLGDNYYRMQPSP